jgi:predicted metalloprotease
MQDAGEEESRSRGVDFVPWSPPQTIIRYDRPARRNSPLTMVSVLGVVVFIVLGVALLGRDNLFNGLTAIDGYPVAVTTLPPVGTPRSTEPGATATPKKAASVYELQTNPLLSDGTSLAPVTCQLAGISRDPEKLRAYYQAAIGCLDQAWQPVLAKANEPFSSPKLEIQAGRSLCGEAPSAEEATAYYCSGGKVIFMPTDRLLEQAGLNQAAHLAVLAHEYGHHVQALSGILNASYDKGEKFGADSPEKLELTRRAELQANCFSGMFIASVAGRGSITTKLARAAADSFRDTVADNTQGTVKQQVTWGKAGFDKNSTAACNTWLAAPADVT